MAGVGQEEQAGAGNGAGEVLGVFAAYDFVVVAVCNEHAGFDGLELLVGPVGLIVPHVGDLGDEGFVLGGRGRDGAVFAAGALDEVGEVGGFVAVGDEAGGDGVGGKGEDAADAGGITHGEVEGDDGAVRPADEIGLGDVELVHEGEDVVGHEVVAVGAGVAGAAAVTSAVDGEDAVRGREGSDLIAPVLLVGESAVQEEDGNGTGSGVAGVGVVEADAVDGGGCGL